jgi:putative transposase
MGKGFMVLPRRWVVERTFGWMRRYRRMSKDYEYRTDRAESMVQIAMIQLMPRRLAPVWNIFQAGSQNFYTLQFKDEL